jgi:hypothetical protein
MSTFKITEGCPEKGHSIQCNSTQPASSFSEKMPSAAQRAEEGMAIYAAPQKQVAAGPAILATSKALAAEQEKQMNAAFRSQKFSDEELK